MFYYVLIVRKGETFHVASPKFHEFELQAGKDSKNRYLWESMESCKEDKRWQHLIQEGDEVKYLHTY
jgi:hypothetical protein